MGVLISAIDRSVAVCTSQVARNYSIVYAACVTAFTGDIVRARRLLTLIDWEAWPPERRHTSMNGLGLVAEAYACLDAYDFEGALEVIRAAMNPAEFAAGFAALTGCDNYGRHGEATSPPRPYRCCSRPRLRRLAASPAGRGGYRSRLWVGRRKGDLAGQYVAHRRPARNRGQGPSV